MADILISLDGGLGVMLGVWPQLAGNLAIVCLAVSLWAHSSPMLRRRSSSFGKAMFGIVVGGASIASMLMAFDMSPGVIVDLHLSLLAVAGMFGGVIAAIIAASLAIVFRISVGGVATLDAAVSIMVITAIGLTLYPTRARSPKLCDVIVLSVAVGGALVVLMSLLPNLSRAGLLTTVSLFNVLLNCLATLLCGFILMRTQRLELEHRIVVTAFSQSPDLVYVKDRDSRFIAVNNNMAHRFRFASPSDLTGLSDRDLFEPSVAEEAYQVEQEVMRTGSSVIDFSEHVGGRCLQYTKVPLRDSEGHVIAIAGVTRDITERKALEEELQNSRNRLSCAMTGMSDGFAMYDAQGFLVLCNERYRSFFPLSGDARVVDAHISDVIRRVVETGEQTDVPRDATEEWLQAACASLHVSKDEVVQLQNGDWRSIKTRLADDGSAIVVVSDITAMKQAEAALRHSAEQLRKLADIDGLTGIVNRRVFDESFAREAGRSARNGTPLSLVMVDVDRFKAYNDIYGHPAGDQCLIAIGKCLLRAVGRSTDIVARYGGEEFVVLLPETEVNGAMIVAEKFSHHLEEQNIVHSGSEFGKVTASIGISCGSGPANRSEPNHLLSIADTALYEAKTQGRNRIAVRLLQDVSR